MKKAKRISAFAAALLITASMPYQISADEDEFIYEIIPETHDTYITVNTNKGLKKISPLIYGINDNVPIEDIYPTVLKQTGSALSSYNWENNCSNSGSSGLNSNDLALVDNYSFDKWNTPALYTESLMAKSIANDVSVSLVTLPMMGYVAADSMGIVSDGDLSKYTRWYKTDFFKNEMYLNSPDTSDDVVYIDEYVSYLVNRFGLSSEGGISGYFLDSEPDKWHEKFSILDLEPITPYELVNRSSELAKSVKAIDSNAYIFGPSLSGLQSYVDLGNEQAWKKSRDFSTEYSWFIDYYLSEMRKKGQATGYRLLDVLDLHYYCEAQTPMGTIILTSTDNYSNAYRMQIVRTLWDPEYTENSMSVFMNKQFTPLIPTLQASIRINYPGTRLSFSEYDFGGGDNISGSITQIDALGTFAREDVFLACLRPLSDDCRFQKAALDIFTNYNGIGDGFGDTLVYSDNENDTMSSVYASIDASAPEDLRIIVTNKNMINNKDMFISIKSDEYEYSLSEVYTIDKNSAEVTQIDDDFIMTTFDNELYFSAETTSVYMLILKGEKRKETSGTTEPDDIIEITDTEESTSAQTEISETTVQTSAVSVTGTTTVDPADETIPNNWETTTASTVSSAENDTESSENKNSGTETSISYEQLPGDRDTDNDDGVAMPVKVLISLMTAAVGLGVVYILIFDRR